MDHPQIKSPASPTLGAALQAETAALRNDLEQATELAAEYQRRLSSKSNDFAALKETLAKAQTDLNAMQGTIGELRTERHRYANEAMRAIALERRLQKIAQERDLLRGELELFRTRCSCDGSADGQVKDISPTQKEVTATPAAQSARPTPSLSQSGDSSRNFIPLPYDEPEEPMDISFSN